MMKVMSDILSCNKYAVMYGAIVDIMPTFNIGINIRILYSLIEKLDILLNRYIPFITIIMLVMIGKYNVY